VDIPPKATDDEEASKDVAFPAISGAAVKEAWGRWSGVMTTGPLPARQSAVQVAVALAVSTPTTPFVVVTSIRRGWPQGPEEGHGMRPPWSA
jgi:hypothetical protein